MRMENDRPDLMISDTSNTGATQTLFFLFIFWMMSSCSHTDHAHGRPACSDEKNATVIYYEEYNCNEPRCGLNILRITNMDSLVYVSSDRSINGYEEIWGKLERINDSIYFVKCFKDLQLHTVEDHFDLEDTFSFICDSPLINHSITIEYHNKSQEKYKIYSTQNQFRINRDHFNIRNERIKLVLDYQHPVVDEEVVIYGLYKGSTVFTNATRLSDFYMVIDSAQVRSLNLYSHQEFTYGPKFRLKRLPAGGSLSKGRMLRKPGAGSL
jgi:hypothetical protein